MEKYSLDDALFEISVNEFDGVIINEKQSLADIPKGYRGLVVEVNDHGNVTLWMCYKNGKLKEIESRV
jgi:hypothetical protein